MSTGDVTVRLAPIGRRVAVSIVATGVDHALRVELDDEGLVLETASQRRLDADAREGYEHHSTQQAPPHRKV
jgi:hypothetical protein